MNNLDQTGRILKAVHMDGSYPIAKFWWAVGYRAAKAIHERAGQNTFNTLAICRPDLSEQIRSTPLDAFYNDGKLDSMCQWIEAHWEDGNSDV